MLADSLLDTSRLCHSCRTSSTGNGRRPGEHIYPISSACGDVDKSENLKLDGEPSFGVRSIPRQLTEWRRGHWTTGAKRQCIEDKIDRRRIGKAAKSLLFTSLGGYKEPAQEFLERLLVQVGKQLSSWPGGRLSRANDPARSEREGSCLAQ